MIKPITPPIIKPVNYTDEMVERMSRVYTATPTRDTVDTLAIDFGKTPRSIIAKLSNLGIYIAPVRTTKTGKPIIKKDALVEKIALALKIECPSLVKANKLDLEKVVQALKDWLGEDCDN